MPWIIVTVIVVVGFAAAFALCEWAARSLSNRDRPLMPGDRGPWDDPFGDRDDSEGNPT